VAKGNWIQHNKNTSINLFLKFNIQKESSDAIKPFVTLDSLQAKEDLLHLI
jgi:hypothetical protein